MSEQRHIGVFHSKGRNFAEVLRRLREQEPEARICAIVPYGYPVGREELAHADEVVETEKAQYSIRDVAGLCGLVTQLRGARFDRFVILFDSPRLRILSALSRARQCAHIALDGRLVSIRPSIAGTIADIVLRHIRGRMLYAWIWIIVHTRRVGRSRLKPGP
ncbi:MAG: hypothetical protein GWP08_03945 [Nitrospiraceae bacterium]|nr:hypothetical protein [Nitrospiraceae bacterium]